MDRGIRAAFPGPICPAQAGISGQSVGIINGSAQLRPSMSPAERVCQLCVLCVLTLLASSCGGRTRTLIASFESLQDGRIEWPVKLEKGNTMWSIGFDYYGALWSPGAYDGSGACHVSYAIENRSASPMRIVDGRGGLNEEIPPGRNIRIFDGPFSNLSCSTGSVIIDSTGTNSISAALILTARGTGSLSKPVAIVAAPLGP